jgi:hypothetical protein
MHVEQQDSCDKELSRDCLVFIHFLLPSFSNTASIQSTLDGIEIKKNISSNLINNVHSRMQMESLSADGFKSSSTLVGNI